MFHVEHLLRVKNYPILTPTLVRAFHSVLKPLEEMFHVEHFFINPQKYSQKGG